MNKLTKILVITLAVFIIILGLSILHPWQRQPTVFYTPLVFPLEAIKGDIIVMEDGSHITINGNQRINSMEQYGNRVIVHSIRHVSLWEFFVGQE